MEGNGGKVTERERDVRERGSVGGGGGGGERGREKPWKITMRVILLCLILLVYFCKNRILLSSSFGKTQIANRGACRLV